MSPWHFAAPIGRLGGTVTSGTEMTPETSRAMLRRDLKQVEPARRARPPRRRTTAGGFAKGGLAVFAVVGLAVACLSPLGAALTPAANASDTSPVTLYTSALGDAQSVQVASQTTAEAASLERDSYAAAIKPKPKPTPTATPVAAKAASFSATFVAPSPGTAQAIAYKMVQARGWDDNEFACLVALWKRESGWRVNASNPSGAYGIPQALPGSKMSSAGADWATNPATQVAWGLGYISSRYGTPCGAWGHSQSSGWY